MFSVVCETKKRFNENLFSENKLNFLRRTIFYWIFYFLLKILDQIRSYKKIKQRHLHDRRLIPFHRRLPSSRKVRNVLVDELHDKTLSGWIALSHISC